MKKILLGILLGSILTLTTSVFASTVKEYVLIKTGYQLLVNGAKYESNHLPVLSYKGSTYVPLKAVGDLLNTNVTWNSKLKRVEINEKYLYLEESKYEGKQLELVKLINLATKHFNQRNLPGFQSLFTDKQIIAYGIWNENRVILATSSIVFKRIDEKSADVFVDQFVKYNNSLDTISYNQTQFNFTKVKNGWKIVMID